MALQGTKMTVPAGDPAVAAPPPVPLAAGGDVLGAGVGVVIDPPPSEHEREEEDAVPGEQEDVDMYLTDDDFSDVEYDSEFEDDDQLLPDVAGGHVDFAKAVPFLGRYARFAEFHNTAVFMRVLPAAAAAAAAPGPGGGEIVVHYRYTRFLRAPEGGGDDNNGVDTHVLGPKLACVRFHLPAHPAAAAGGGPASSALELAGAALAPLIYPARFDAQLRAMWSALVTAWPVPRATATTRVVVTVDAGILRHRDWTPARMRSMLAAVESLAWESDADREVGAELLLPAPLASEDDVRPAKRRRIAGEDDCPICCEVLEQGLAAWPRCSHIFHATCLEEHLIRGSQECPMCRSGLEVDRCPGRDQAVNTT
ncbi:unnamed protein product [Urochloa humidicola]